MAHFALIFFCLGAGIFFKSAKVWPENGSHVLNQFIIYISFPALTLLKLNEIPLFLDQKTWVPVLVPWGILLFSLLVFGILGHRLHWPKKITGALILMAGLGNTSFVGFPLLQALYGREALNLGVLIDQPGSFLALSTMGLGIASFYSEKKFSLSQAACRIFSFPPFLALVLGLATKSRPYPPALKEFLEMLSVTLVPLALVSVGAQLKWKFSLVKKYKYFVLEGLIFKLVFAPAVVLVILKTLDFDSFSIRVTTSEAAMAPMITGAIISSQYGLDEELTSLMISVGIPISIITVIIWSKII